MARFKKTSNVLDKALKRLAGMQALNPNLDLGNGIKVPDFAAEILKLEQVLASYHQLLAQCDTASNTVNSQEVIVRELSERMLEGFGSKYGHYSSEYEMAGGKRKNERKKAATKTKTA
jgi:hypothetical protein